MPTSPVVATWLLKELATQQTQTARVRFDHVPSEARRGVRMACRVPGKDHTFAREVGDVPHRGWRRNLHRRRPRALLGRKPGQPEEPLCGGLGRVLLQLPQELESS